VKNAVLPLAGFGVLTARRIAVCAVVLAGAAAAVPVTTVVMVPLNGFASIPGDDWSEPLRTVDHVLAALVVLSTALLSWVHARYVPSGPARLVVWPSMGWAAALGALNGLWAHSINTALGMFTARGLEIELHAAFLLSTCAGPIGVLFGLAFGVAYAVPLWIARRARERPAHDDAERALVSCGLWLVPAGVLGALVPLATWCKAIGVFVALVGLSSAAAGAWLIRRRRHWLNAVLAGKLADFAVKNQVEASELSALIPFCRQRGDRYSAVLVARTRDDTSPYRLHANRALALLAVPFTDTADTASPQSTPA